jgi:cyclopropane fatty-acyl-phospholipid synthase-like methyltransferase
MNIIYEMIYHIMQIFPIPNAWVFGDKQALLDGLLAERRIAPGRTIDLGCGVGEEAIYLARKGFDMTGVDSSPTAIKLARDRARKAGVEVTFLEDDLTNLRKVAGSFDLMIDFGAFNDLDQQQRDQYRNSIMEISAADSRFILMGFEKKLSQVEVEHHFGQHFTIEVLDKRSEGVSSRKIVTYWLNHK